MIDDLSKNINDSVNKINSIIDVLALSSYAHLQLLTIHPFADGNGRTARLLQNFILLKKNMPLLIIRKELKGDYIRAIKSSREKDAVEPFADFIMREYKHHLKNEINRLNEMNKGKNKGFTFTLNL